MVTLLSAVRKPSSLLGEGFQVSLLWSHLYSVNKPNKCIGSPESKGGPCFGLSLCPWGKGINVIPISFREGILRALFTRHLGNVRGDEGSEVPEWLSGQ